MGSSMHQRDRQYDGQQCTATQTRQHGQQQCASGNDGWHERANSAWQHDRTVQWAAARTSMTSGINGQPVHGGSTGDTTAAAHGQREQATPNRQPVGATGNTMSNKRTTARRRHDGRQRTTAVTGDTDGHQRTTA